MIANRVDRPAVELNGVVCSSRFSAENVDISFPDDNLVPPSNVKSFTNQSHPTCRDPRSRRITLCFSCRRKGRDQNPNLRSDQLKLAKFLALQSISLVNPMVLLRIPELS